MSSSFVAAVTSREAAVTRVITDLSVDAISHVLYFLLTAFDINDAARVCRLFRLAARLANEERRYSDEVVTLTQLTASYSNCVWDVAMTS